MNTVMTVITRITESYLKNKNYQCVTRLHALDKTHVLTKHRFSHTNSKPKIRRCVNLNLHEIHNQYIKNSPGIPKLYENM